MKSDCSSLRFKTGLMGLFLFVFLVAEPAETQTDLENQQDPKVLYDQMLSSSEHYHYKGILTYEQGGQLQSFSVDSVVGKYGIEQKLELLNGPQREHHFLFQPSCEKKRKLESDQLSAYYNFYNRGTTRIAGYEGTEIVLRPYDKYRNGYQFVIENESKLMLRSMTLKPDRRMIERAQFAQLAFSKRQLKDGDDSPNQDELTVEEGEEAVIALEEQRKEPNKVACNQLSIETGWLAGWLPVGFKVLDSRLDGDRAILVFSDGISTFSVFIDAVIEGFLPPSNAQRGATTVYIDYLSDPTSTYLVSIIGEIPLATADRVLKSLRRK